MRGGGRTGRAGTLSPVLAPLPSLTHPNLWENSERLGALFPLSLTLTTCVCGSPLSASYREAQRLAPRHTAGPEQSPKGSFAPRSEPPGPSGLLPGAGQASAVPPAARVGCPARTSGRSCPRAAWLVPAGARSPLPASCPPPASDSRPQYPRHALRSPPAAGQFTEHTKELTQFKDSKSR